MKIRDHRDLQVWQRLMKLAERVYALVKNFPADERYALGDQLRRAAVSVPSNIAEGAAYQSTKDFIRFLSIARGSLAEMETQLMLASNLGLAKKQDTELLIVEIGELVRMLTALQRSLKD
jgi:four helix bundle protein